MEGLRLLAETESTKSYRVVALFKHVNSNYVSCLDLALHLIPFLLQGQPMGTESILLEMPFTRVNTHLAIPDFVRCTLLES